MKVTYVDHMGTDLSVVNAARVSFDKVSYWANTDRMIEYPGIDPELSSNDVRLINFLARHNHWTPFGHTAVTLHVKAPLFVARQLGKHQVGLVWNEVSRRYVDSDPEFYMPDEWRKRAENVKQGSSDETVTQLRHEEGHEDLRGPFNVNFDITTHVEASNHGSLMFYKELLESGVCPEQARMVLPQSMYTEWYWTGSIAAFSRVYKLRIDPHSQKETQEVAKQIGEVISPLFPKSWEALTE